MNFSATVLTIFPDMFPGVLGKSVIGNALQSRKWNLNTVNIRDFAIGKHKQIDDTPYGGGAGMVMRADVVDAAISHAKHLQPESRLIYMSPRGKQLNQELVRELSTHKLIILCGRFEGVDERVIQHHAMEEISIGDYILAGGEVAAMVLIEACVRLLPGVLGEANSIYEESFAYSGNYAGLLEYPQYTKPPLWKGLSVPEVLRSGNHRHIEEWRLAQAEYITRQRRPDLWARQKGKSDEPVTED